jgi:cytoskeletal protein RodZ
MFGLNRITRHGAAGTARGFEGFDLRLGDQMRGERATMSKSLMDVQRELRIKASFISAIENADVEAFDSPSFIPGYVRSYARYLGMDPDEAFGRFCAETGFGGAESFGRTSSPARTSERQSFGLGRGSFGRAEPLGRNEPDPLGLAGNPFARKSRPAFAGFEPGALGSLLVLGTLVGGLGYGGWLLVQEVQRVQVAPVEQEPVIVAELDPLEPVATPEGPEATVDPVARAEALNRLYRPRVLETPIIQARDAPIATLPPGAPSSISAFSATEPEEVAPPVPETVGPFASTNPLTAAVDAAVEEALAIQEAAYVAGEQGATVGELPPQVVAEAPEPVVVVAVRDSWVRVRDAEGATLYEKVMTAGETWEVPVTEAPPTLDTGNAGAVYMAVRGETYGPVGENGSVVRRVPLAEGEVRDAYSVADLDGDSDLGRVVAELSAPDPE